MAKDNTTAAETTQTESKADAFKRIGTRRLNEAVDKIRLLEALANKAQYEYTTEQVQLILDTLAKSCNKVLETFKSGKPQVAGGVQL